MRLPELLAACREQIAADIESPGSTEPEYSKEARVLVAEIDKALLAYGGETLSPVERGIFGDGTVQERLFKLRAWSWWRGASPDVMGAIVDAAGYIERIGGEEMVHPARVG